MNNLNNPLANRERLQLSVRFFIRAGQKTGEKPRQLYVRLKVNGTTCSDYACGVYVRPTQWNSSQQKVTGCSKLAQETNKEIESILADHKQLLAELNRLYQATILPHAPTAELLRFHWIQKTPLIPTLLSAFSTYLEYLTSLDGTPDAREKRTLDKWRNGYSYLEEYIVLRKAERLTVDLLTIVWAKDFYYFLIKRPLGQATAARFVGYLRASINHLVATGKISANPIAGYFPDKGKDKEVYFMESVHLDRLWQIPCSTPVHAIARDWLLLMSYTGMDQPDLERYVEDPSAFEEESEAGPMIVINRGKTGLSACIPILPEVGRILGQYPNGLPTLSNQTINDWTRIIQLQIDFEHRLTTKICRKTAGALFLRMGLRIEEVSKVLGHSSIQTTMRNYVRVTGAMVKAGMLRIQGQNSGLGSSLSNTPFRRSA